MDRFNYPKPGLCAFNVKCLKGMIVTARGRVHSDFGRFMKFFTGDGFLLIKPHPPMLLNIHHMYTLIGRVSQAGILVVWVVRDGSNEGDDVLRLYANTLRLIHYNKNLFYESDEYCN